MTRPHAWRHVKCAVLGEVARGRVGLGSRPGARRRRASRRRRCDLARHQGSLDRGGREGLFGLRQGFGESDCATPAECFRSSANPYRNTDPPGLWLRADCADLIYLMRAYYAWKNGLPFSYAVSVTPREGGGGDIRFNLSGNRIVARRDVKTGANAVEVLRAIPDQVSSATFRVSYLFDRGQETSDFYSPKIGRDTIRPGTVIYDINGHVAIVYKVEDDGRVLYLDAHPDQTLTRSAFGAQFSRGDPALGSGFKNFRPIELTGATRRGDGVLVGGRIEIASNGQIAEFGTEQFLGTSPIRAATGTRENSSTTTWK